MIAAVLQPGYLPWLGYFEQLLVSDVFVALDDVQFTKNDWRNRNRVKGPAGAIWLTVPVQSKGRFGQRILDVRIDNEQPWARKHWRTVEHSYRRAPYFDWVAEELAPVYRSDWGHLVDLDLEVADRCARLLGIDRPVVRSSGLGVDEDDPNRRLVAICQAVDADTLYEGASGAAYIDVPLFAASKLIVRYQDYRHPTYPQQWPDVGFVPHLSVIDLLANCGPASLDVLAGRASAGPDGRVATGRGSR